MIEMPLPTAQMTEEISRDFRENHLPKIHAEEREKLRGELINKLIRYRDLSPAPEQEKLLEIITHFIR
jgi:hypothetical protein